MARPKKQTNVAENEVATSEKEVVTQVNPVTEEKTMSASVTFMNSDNLLNSSPKNIVMVEIGYSKDYAGPRLWPNGKMVDVSAEVAQSFVKNGIGKIVTNVN